MPGDQLSPVRGGGSSQQHPQHSQASLSRLGWISEASPLSVEAAVVGSRVRGCSWAGKPCTELAVAGQVGGDRNHLPSHPVLGLLSQFPSPGTEKFGHGGSHPCHAAGEAPRQETRLFLIVKKKKKKRAKFVSHLPSGWITNLTQMGNLCCFCGKLDAFSIPTRAA